MLPLRKSHFSMHLRMHQHVCLYSLLCIHSKRSKSYPLCCAVFTSVTSCKGLKSSGKASCRSNRNCGKTAADVLYVGLAHPKNRKQHEVTRFCKISRMLEQGSKRLYLGLSLHIALVLLMLMMVPVAAFLLKGLAGGVAWDFFTLRFSCLTSLFLSFMMVPSTTLWKVFIEWFS